jgi:energy-coupling factor transport system permease protein
MSSRFEFLGSTALGQYIPRISWFHERDPRARLLSFFFLFIALVFARSIWGLVLGSFSVLIIYAVSRLPIRSTWRGILRALPFILILAILQLVFTSPAEPYNVLWTFFGLEISTTAVYSAAMLIFRFIVLIAHLNVLVMSLSTAQITAALFYILKPLEKLHFPVNDLTLVAQITLRYLPLVAQMAEKTAKAQAARGGDWEQKGFNPIRQAKRVIPLIVPLIINSLKRAEIMAMAMESRGFNAAKQRSSYYQLTFDWQDWGLLLISLAISSLLIMWNWIL